MTIEHGRRQAHGVGWGQTFVCARAEEAGQREGRMQASGRGGDVPQVFVANVRYPGCSCAVAGAGGRVADPEETPRPPLSAGQPRGAPSGTRLRRALTRKLKIGCVRRALRKTGVERVSC